ncbi:histidine phosphatase family protein [Streptomyces sp. B1866]|uniref:histidine phosphatase family protein n=1 Tax=Streptomyces sp. B1866 TaxID=3075431 RepID=UPI00289293A4|nr:histidine phosphatase family protein [Streptomyces sp. B1866]MDT3396550.1 histidine phosphatase family protein [Streptomyces sp. B1866]
MPVIHLVRHGQASFHAETYDVLSDLGREQARVVGAELARRGLRDPVVHCGTLDRQRDTAELLMAAAGLDGRPHADPRWNEYDHLALLDRYPTPWPAEEPGSRGVQVLLDHALGAWIHDADTGPNGWRAFTDGAAAALAGLTAALGSGRDAVVVTSGGVLAALCGALLPAPPAGIVALNRVTVNAAITTLAVGRSGTSLLTFNDHAHFAGDLRALVTYR